MKRILSTSTLMVMALTALALAPAMKLFDSTYGVKPDSTLGKAKCAVCHTTKMGGKKLNGYGKALQDAMAAEGAKKLTVEILKKVEAMDSDKDGMSNVAEIKADRTPGG